MKEIDALVKEPATDNDGRLPLPLLGLSGGHPDKYGPGSRGCRWKAPLSPRVRK